jgi:hypothetical protein
MLHLHQVRADFTRLLNILDLLVDALILGSKFTQIVCIETTSLEFDASN